MNVNNVAFNDIDNKNTQEKFTWAVTYVAQAEQGTGLNPIKFDVAMDYLKSWKRNLVQFLIGKPIRNGVGNHTKETAVACADSVFKRRYEAEVAAFAQAPIECWWTRNEMGPIEFGELEVDKLGRLAAEDSDIYVLPRAWSSKQQMKRNYGQLLSFLAQGKSPRIVLRNAKNLMRMYAISKEQYASLVENAGGIFVAANKSQQEQIEINL